MRNTIVLLFSILLTINLSKAQNVDSFTVSNPNPKFCDWIKLISLSTNCTSLQWIIPEKGIVAGAGFPNDSVANICVFDVGCFDVKLIVCRGVNYDTIIQKCVFNVPSFMHLLGKNPDTVEVGTPYIEMGALFDSNLWPPIKMQYLISGIVDTTKFGKNILKYYEVDTRDNSIIDSLERVVYVIDTKCPVISLKGNEVFTIEVNTQFVDPGLEIKDNSYSGFTTERWGSFLSNFPDETPTKIGNFIIFYKVTDAAGNNSERVARVIRVVDTTPPVIKWHRNIVEIFGICRGCKDTLDFNLWDYVEVTDNYDTNLKVDMSGDYFSNYLINFEEGIYYIMFTAKDLSGNHADTVVILIMVRYNSVPESQNPIATIFPNPSNGTFKLNITNPEIADFVRIVDMTGKLILSITPLQQSNEITLPNYCQGMYILQVVTQKGVFSEKINLK